MNAHIDDLTRDILEMESFDCERNFIKTQKRVSRYTTRRIFTYAAGAAMAAAIVLFAVLNYQKDDVELLVAHAPVGQVVTVTLPDSSVVYLNSGSTLTYPEKFASDKREVSLEGQGWFKVYASHTYPFYVNTTKGMTLYVYGTEFDVAAYPQERDIEIYLASGNLNMMLPVKNVECTVKPNQKLTYDTVKESIDVQDIPGGMGYDWKEGNLCFRHSTISEILTTLTRRFNVVMDAVNVSADDNEYHVSFTSSETLEDILTQLSGLSELTWHNVGTDAEGRKHITVKY